LQSFCTGVDPSSALPGSLPEDREHGGVLVRTRKRSQVRDERSDIIEPRLLVLLEVEAEPAGGEAAVALWLLPGDQRG
jgi:hypothetical protein